MKLKQRSAPGFILLGILLLLTLVLFWQRSHHPAHQEPTPASRSASKEIPEAAYRTWEYIRTQHRAPENYTGGREFRNLESKLPEHDAQGSIRHYREWDIYPHRRNRGRGPKRIVTTDEEQRAWYTPDHYKTFVEMHY